MASKTRIGINGFGRIGRTVFRIVSDRDDMEIAAVNDLFDNDQLAYLLKYDTVMRVFPKDVRAEKDAMWVAGKRVAMTEERDPAKIPDRQEHPQGEDQHEDAEKGNHDRLDVSRKPV